MMALVAIVEPCLRTVTVAGSTPTLSSASITPSMNVGGVEGTFALRISPVAVSRQTRSEKVPPMSTATMCWLIQTALALAVSW